ncbi:mucin-5AC-like [Oreochromis aureus]|uniref:Uncharacterized protein n=1 Tax=Oreochromis aureus TaxID=47969 RepID=A0AAZ1WWB9_OREAU|nr:mucin-5AC-like [Oreochromis aureus]
MDSKLVLTLLFVTLTGWFMGTYAQNTTVAPTISVTPVPTTITNATSNTPTPTITNTTAPSNTTAAPSNTTAAPSNTTAAPSNTTAAPSNTTAAPSNTTAAPSNTTAAPSNTTAAPSNTTAAPSNTTAAPSNTTAAPSNTTAAPSNTTAAPSNTTAAPPNTTAAPSNTTAAPSNTTAAPSNTTAAPSNTTTAPPNTTAAPSNTTAAPSNTTAAPSNTTAAPSNTTAAPPNTTAAPSNTTAAPSNTTAAPSNTTAAPSNTTTAPPNTTAAPTTPAPLVPDTNVTILNASITRTECGRKQLCAAQPRDCDPSNGTCFFLGAQALGGQNFMFDLAGESDGYIAATLSRNTQGVNDTTYICANNNGVVKFFSALLNNGKLTLTTLKVNTVRGKVSGKNIQCQFAATVPDSTSTTTKADTSTTSFSVSVSTGTYNATSEDLGSPTAKITTGVVDLANINATTDNQINSTTTTAPSNTTAAPTTPAPLVPDSTVTTLNTSLTRDNCSKTQLCVSKPSGCDPSSGTCFFLGAQQLGGQNFRFSLAGQSDGYVALTLSRNTTQGTNDTTYICANNNSVVKYISALLNNGKLTRTTLNVNNVKGKVNGKNIQCQFDATIPDSSSTTTRAATSTTSFSVSVSNGTYNATSDDLGSPTAQIRTNVVDLSNVTAAINNLITNAANAITIQQSMIQVLLITVGILTLSWL